MNTKEVCNTMDLSDNHINLRARIFAAPASLKNNSKLLTLNSSLKRSIDLFISLCALIILSPLMLFVAQRIRLEMGSPVLFSQWRPGLRGKPFKMYKFRSMSEACDENGVLLPDEQRLTPLGAFLRRSSIDELPELINIIKGQMSLVGPRPLLMRYLPRYNSIQARRHEVKPGLTGLAQVSGRNAISWQEKLALDVCYVDNHSIWLDLKILLLTAHRVVTKQGINSDSHATMEEFMGSGENHS